MKIIVLLVTLSLLSGATAFSQNKKEKFTITKEIQHLPVLNQGSTGTCWSFASTSFLESEIIRKGFEEVDLSEMFFVYHNYKNKAFQYLLYHGNNNFGEGSVSHDVLKILSEQGIASYESYPGIMIDGRFRHGDLERQLKKEVDLINRKKRSEIDVSDLDSYNPILKEQIGGLPKKIKTENGKVTPIKLKEKYKLNAEDYVELSSYSHHPFYKPFVLEIPDNWAHASYYNLPLDELMEVMYFALNNGYSIAWDGDTSEKTFNHKTGKADVPKKQIGKVNQELRQKTFYDRTSTDDHLMHVVGLSKDSEGRTCFYTKNSWGTDSNEYGGYLHMTEDYVRLKTIAILVHKDAIPKKIKGKLNL